MAVSQIDPNGLNVGQLGGSRNMVINSAMQVAQRGTSATGQSSGGYYACDRAKIYYQNLSQMVFSVAQDSSSPDGFDYSHKVTVTTAETAYSGTDLISPLFYSIEGQDLQQLNYGSVNAKPLTLSFWVKSNVTGTYTLSAYSSIGGANSIQAPTYTINTADTWEYKTLAISGNTTRGIVDSNGLGMDFYWNGLVGSQYTSGTQSASWSNYAQSNWAVGHTADFGLDVNDYWQITGVQLEVGDTSTDFEHISYGDQLQKCQRYYQRYGGTDNYFMLVGNAAGATLAYIPTTLQTRMRAAPTFSTTGTMSDYRYQSKSGDVTPNAIALDQAMEDCVAVAVTTASNALTAGHAVRLFNITNAGYFAFDAEL